MSNLAHEIVTDRILEALAAGVVPWEKPWTADGCHHNGQSGRAYSGINVFLLGAHAAVRGYDRPDWYTWTQAKDYGGIVKGGKAARVVWCSRVKKKDPDKSYFALKSYNVFNGHDVKHAPELLPADAVEPERIPTCEEVVRSYLKNGGPEYRETLEGRAYYRPSADLVAMPRRSAFDTSTGRYSMLFHQLAHSTGHPTRLDRTGIMSSRFGTDPYAREELVAELAAALLCAECRVPLAIPNRAAYIEGWRKKLASDPDKGLAMKAATAAGKAAAMISGSLGAEEVAA